MSIVTDPDSKSADTFTKPARNLGIGTLLPRDSRKAVPSYMSEVTHTGRIYLRH